MVKVIGYSLKENKEGKEFVSLELQGEITMVQSAETGNFYATARKASINSTFDEQTALSLIGSTLPGRIEKVECAEYELVDKTTGEVKYLSHRNEFVPENEVTPMRVVASEKAA